MLWDHNSFEDLADSKTDNNLDTHGHKNNLENLGFH